MATTNRVYIFAAFVFSITGVLFNIVSLSTEQWITGKAAPDDNTYFNYINYGLFQGNYKRNIPSSIIYQVTMTCSFKTNVCALLCGSDGTDRKNLLDSLYYNGSQDYAYANCPTVSTTLYQYYFKDVESSIIRSVTSNISPDTFINAAVWLSTLIFLILAAHTGFISAVLALYNTVTNPTQYIFSVKGLFIYNSIAFAFTVFYMVLWGTMYNLIIFHNVGVYDTLAGSISSDKMSYLGYSYWISFISLASYAGSIGILYYREYLNERDPKQQVVSLDNDVADHNLILY